MKNTRIIAGLCGLLALSNAGAGTVSQSDPVPNVTDPAPDGGVGYTWTVLLGGADSASLEGVVGAWSWDEDGFPDTAKGWTHTSNWVALRLTRESKVTVRLFRKENVPNPAGGVGGNLLFPAFTLYRNWDGDGGDSHNYNNRGDVAWAEDLSYLAHVENDGSATSVVLTLELPAGLYSIALGGNSPSTNREPVQGYGATITTRPVDLPEILLRRPVSSTWQRSMSLHGRIAYAEKAGRLFLSRSGRRSPVRLQGDRWVAPVSGLKPGRNVVSLLLESKDGKIVDRKRVAIHRRRPVVPSRVREIPPLSPRGGVGRG